MFPIPYHSQFPCKSHISPEEEGCVAGVLQGLPRLVGPLLVIRVPEVVDGPGVPMFAQRNESAWPEPVLGHDDKVHEEPCGRLDETELATREEQHSLVKKTFVAGVAGPAFHALMFHLFA